MKRLLAVIGALSLLLAGCATTEFKPYEAKNNVFEGKGGTKVVIEGVDVWDNGEPPRKFTVLGVIDDDRPQHPVLMLSVRSDIAKKAKASGGDGVIQAGSKSELFGISSSGSIRQWNYSKYFVIKYLD